MLGPLITILAVGALISIGTLGCSSSRGGSSGQQASSVKPQKIQAATMNFANRYTAAVADVYDQILKATTPPQIKFEAQRAKITECSTAVGNAVELNPIIGLMDMTMMVVITHEIAEEPWVKELYAANPS